MKTNKKAKKIKQEMRWRRSLGDCLEREFEGGGGKRDRRRGGASKSEED